jgi:hypothetical protein
VAKRPLLYLVGVWYLFATRGIIEPPHRLLQSPLGGVQVRRSLRQVPVSQHLLHMMDGPASFEPPAAGLVPEIVKMQIDGPQCAA